MIPLPMFPARRGLPAKIKAALFALALALSMSAATAQTGALAQQADCPAEVSANTGALAADCALDAAMMQSLDILPAHGLDPDAYRTHGANARDAWLLAATHLRRGVLDPETLAPRVTADKALATSLDALPAASDAAAYGAALDAFAPSSSLYSALQTELLRQQYGHATSENPQVTAASGARIAKLLVGLEHLRWLPHETTARRIYANIPGFEVVAFSGEKEVSRHLAIFGELGRQTPEFSDSIEFLEFSPWWHVPASIARGEKLTQFQRDPGEIERLGYQIFDSAGKRVNAAEIDWDAVSASDFPYRIQQAPGPSNALGQVKFMFPNSKSIYLHDTPDGGLFSQTQRAASAGCIRVQEATGLSEWVLADAPGWGRARIDDAVGSATATRAELASPMSIHIIYLTAFPAADGTIAYAPDIYGKDAEILPALTGYALKA